MLTVEHEAALAGTPQRRLGHDLLSRLASARGFIDRIRILEEAEESFGQVDVRDHALRVARAARDLAEHCGFERGYCNKIANATRLHDVGKLFMPASILDKDGAPTEDEFRIIREHARHGGELLGDGAPEFVINVARYHHERYDGRGYNGLVGENIPLEARIVQIADVYDALRSERSYKPGMTEEEALLNLVEMHGRGVMFDPFLIRKFVELRLERAEDSLTSAARTRLRDFAVGDPMEDLDRMGREVDFEGWRIDRKGMRRKYVRDHAIDYDVLLEVVTPHGAKRRVADFPISTPRDAARRPEAVGQIGIAHRSSPLPR